MPLVLNRHVVGVFACFFGSACLGPSVRAHSSQAGYGLEILTIEPAGEDKLSVVFEETTTKYSTYKFETSIDLTASVGVWSELIPTEFILLEDGLYEAVFPISRDEGRYFRITGAGSLFDSDGDGVSNEVEAFLGTNPELPDSDRDGFSDLVEINAETDPKNASESPPYTFLPSVRFVIDEELIFEGDYTHSIRLESDKPIYGEVEYTISLLSNAFSADAVAVTNTVRFDGGTTGEISLRIQDDAELEQIEIIVLDLLDAEDGSYRTGDTMRHTVLIEDNDALWTGAIVENGAETSFRFSLVQEGTEVTGQLLSSSESPSGIIPEGAWDLSCSLTDDTFTAVSDPLPMESSLLFDIAMERRLTIEVVPPDDPENLGEFEAYYFTPRLMVGILSDSLVAADGASSFFNQSSKALVVLVRDLQLAEEITVPEVSQ